MLHAKVVRARCQHIRVDEFKIISRHILCELCETLSLLANKEELCILGLQQNNSFHEYQIRFNIRPLQNLWSNNGEPTTFIRLLFMKINLRSFKTCRDTLTFYFNLSNTLFTIRNFILFSIYRTSYLQVKIDILFLHLYIMYILRLLCWAHNI